MKRIMILCFVFLVLGFFISPKDINYIKREISKDIDEAFPTDSRQKEDFKVNISVNPDKKPEVIASITYIGEKEKIDVSHAMRIFYFSLKQLDGDYEIPSTMPFPLKRTTLIKNEPHEEKFHINYDELKPDTYEIKATAGFSTDNEKGISIPVSKTIKITKQPKMQRETKKVGDYQVGIYTNKDKVFDVKAKITYYGKEEYKDISHSNRVFELSIKQLDGDFEWKSTTTQEASGSSLLKAIPYEETFESYNEGNSGKSFYDLKPGIYEFKATAIFTVNEKAMEMPVSTIVKIEKE